MNAALAIPEPHRVAARLGYTKNAIAGLMIEVSNPIEPARPVAPLT